MELYLIRHGIAVEREAYSNDEERSLTHDGEQKTRKIAKRLHSQNLRFDLILTSPLVRARQTAEILKSVHLSSNLEEFPALAPTGDINTWLNWLQEWRYKKAKSCLALVGHQPDLGHWAEILVWGTTKGGLIMKKAGLIGLELPETEAPVGKSKMFLLASPKWLL